MKRPLSVTLISYLYIVSGTVGIIYHASEFSSIDDDPDFFLVLAIRVLAIVGGLLSLRGINWARWVLVFWIGYHVVLSFYHTASELIMHAVLMIVVIIALFNPRANAYFKK